MGDPVLEMLARIRDRPVLFIGAYSAEILFIYLQGYVDAPADHTSLDMTKYAVFIESLFAKYGRGGGGHSWASVLGQVAGGDQSGLDLFFRELVEFRKSTHS